MYSYLEETCDAQDNKRVKRALVDSMSNKKSKTCFDVLGSPKQDWNVSMF